MNWTHQPSLGSLGGATKEPGGGYELGESPLSFAGFRLEPDGSLFRGVELVHLAPRELAALRLLLAHAGQIVTPAQLKQALWGDVHVTAESIPKCLSALRARLQPEDCIQTVYKRGYRLLAQVQASKSVPVNALPRLAIPPFVSDPSVPEHLGTTIAEETIARLSNAQRPFASILARDSVFTLALRGLTAQKIGEALNADLVLAGTLRALPTHFRLRVEMIRVADGVQIWVEDLLVERDRIAGLELVLASRLDFRLKGGPADSEPADCGPARTPDSWEMAFNSESADEAPVLILEGSARPTSSKRSRRGTFSNVEGVAISAASAAEAAPALENGSKSHRSEAYEIFRRGHHEWQTLERHRMQDGQQQLAQAIELDPSLLAAKVDLAHLCVTQSFYGFMSPTMAADLVRRTADSIPDYAQQARAILPALAWVHYHFDRSLPAALWAFKRAANLPHDPWITRVRTMFALSRHRFADAIAVLREAIELDPYSPWLNARLAWALHLGGQAAASMEQIEHAIRLFPDHEGSGFYGAMILAYNGDAERGIRLAQELAQRQPYFDLATSAHAYALACAGRTAEARVIVERLQWLGRERFVLNSFTAAVYVALGDLDSALAELRAANDSRCPWLFQMLADPRLKPLHGRREFEELRTMLRQMEATAESADIEI